MDRAWTTPWDDRDGIGDRSDDLILPSRAPALAALRAAIEMSAGPALLTGEAGVGKTWLWRRLRAAMPARWRTIGVDLSPANDPAEVGRAIGHALGLEAVESIATTRRLLADFLEESSADGQRWVLIIDEAQGVSAAVLEEVRILGNRLGRPDGFAGLVLVGQTALARRLATRPLSALSARMAARVHLRPIDVDEARRLVDREVAGASWDEPTLECRHRDARGNPTRLLQLARLDARAVGRRPIPPPVVPVLPAAPARAPEAQAPAPAEWDPPVLGPAKPPLHIEDGLIEVGWEPEPEMLARPDDPAPAGRSAALEPPAEESIDDHYTALQAWTEWARNQGRAPFATQGLSPAASGLLPETAAAEAREDVGDSSFPAVVPPEFWAEGEQTFAPYSQLFSRLKQRKDSN